MTNQDSFDSSHKVKMEAEESYDKPPAKYQQTKVVLRELGKGYKVSCIELAVNVKST